MSYSRRDQAVMERALKFLRKQGVKFWLDNEKLIPGTPIWEREIEKAIKTAAAVVVICSPDSNESEWVRREITFAERYRKRIFPVLVRGDEDTSISIRLSTRQYVDIRQNEEIGIRSLAMAISFYLKELEEQEREERERKATPTVPVYESQKEPISRVESPTKSNWLPFGIVGVVIIGLIFGGMYIYQNFLAPNELPPTEPAQVERTGPPALEPVMTNTPKVAFTSTSRPTKVPTPTLDVGSTMISEKDGMVMVYVPTGEFEMGSENGDDDEKPVHAVYLDAFWIDQTEVTNAMYAKCVAAGECDSPSLIKSDTRDSYYGDLEFDDYPVIYVTWNDAIAYCEWAGRRLPTEAEWEKAASWEGKNRTKFVYPWGDSINCSQANYWGKDGGCIGDTTTVGSYESGQSPYGAYDMAGNVWEWVSSLYQSYPYSATDGREDLSASGSRVLRGGAWYDDYSSYIRTADRNEGDPTGSSGAFGFRCARDAEP
jgi:formylglycine-generating enzyme required for sulfatase activity